jgi:hypothetical protein
MLNRIDGQKAHGMKSAKKCSILVFLQVIKLTVSEKIHNFCG